ncbi:DNA mismatch repair endonuclease MutL [Shewanella intestini]|uniref:DNA mismatch repair protein MutL n=1 Tax=Shewanella intestini TaxID=2017544 RepID=A0ABS5I0Y1_9GAMM|nr:MULTISPECIES: DNA mismatch repair endonuclease MutL [Shewanella]MBR9727684.1 DNA mismatch repair endonuclease MutL [Shewanella intestini]MRG35166.1 DNA mismatch repair endonuclease MutL [Shewanella sp. XMDDZSB0408]
MAIEQLPPQLANQIAAGEVVERPASVVKELVENSLDAGATKIEIDIEKGGSKLIRIRDNGSGIAKEELTLALSRHATSKVHSLDDLEAILSFGFRGEALASVSSVSRLTLTSRTEKQSEAWQAFAEGSQMAVKIVPAAHPQGSTIEVADIFFNTPARRRFLKSDKTEFTHIDEWLKRIALARTEIQFVLSHNGKVVRKYRAANTEIQLQQRIAQVCGKSFAEQALTVACEHDGLSLSGYIQSPNDPVQTDTHYFYVNGRLVRDRLVNHAVKQAFNEFGYQLTPNFVLKLDLDPHQVDVNVHPAKHEVRFHQARYIHDYILQALQSVLAQITQPSVLAVDDGIDVSAEQYQVNASSYSDQVNDDKLGLSSHQALLEQGNSETVSKANSDEIKPIDRATLGPFNSHSPFGRMHIPSKQGGIQTSHFVTGQTCIPQSGFSDSAGKNTTNLAEVNNTNGAHNNRQPGQTIANVTPQAVQSYANLLSTPDYVAESDGQGDIPTKPPLLDGQYWVITFQAQLLLLDIKSVNQFIVKQQILAKLPTGLVSQPLLMPTSVAADPDWAAIISQRDNLLRKLGIEVTIRYQQLIIKKVPPYLRNAQLASVIPDFIQWITIEEPTDSALAQWLVEHNCQSLTDEEIMWQQYCLLDAASQAFILQQANSLPWQQWIKEQNCDDQH